MRYWLAATIGVVLLAAYFLVMPRDALAAYLSAYAFTWSIALGALTLAMIGRLTEARWYMENARRPTEALVATIPLLAILFAPIALGLSHLYPWVWTVDPARASFLSTGFFLARSTLYLATWATLAVLLRQSPRTVSAVGLPLVGLTTTFAAFDWIMSLEPQWSSAAFGLYVWTGGFQAALALIVLRAPRRESALAKLLLTASIFWAYIAYSQGFIIWIAQIPRETSWYVARTSGAWTWVLVTLVLARFAVPFLALLPYAWKRRARVQVAVSVLVIGGHALDMHWLVAPAVHGRFAFGLVHLAALVALSSFLLGAAEEEQEVVTA